MELQTIVKAFLAWDINVQTKLLNRACLTRLVSKIKSKIFARTWKRWEKFVQNDRLMNDADHQEWMDEEKQKAMRKISLRLQHSRIIFGWGTWHAYYKQQQKYDNIIRKCSGRLRNRHLSMAYYAWKEYRATRRRHKRNIIIMLANREKRWKRNILLKWRVYCGRQARNKRVIAKQAAKRLFGDLRGCFRGWHEEIKRNLATVRERKRQLRRIWGLKRKRYQFLALHIWRLGVQSHCRECGNKLRGKFVPKAVSLAQMQNNKKVDDIDWSHREKMWNNKLPPGHRTGGNLFSDPDKLPAVRPPLKRMKPYVPKGGTSSIRMLKQIIDRASEVKEMTVKARMELEASNIVMNTFINTFGVNPDDVSDSGAESVPESEKGDRDDDFLDINETGKLGSDKLLNDSAILESYEKQTLLRYETSKKDAMKVDVRHGREHKQYVSQQAEEKKKVILQKKQLQAKQKNDVKKHARFLPEVKEF